MPITRRDFVRTLFAASQVGLAGKLLSTSLYAGEPPVPAGLNFAIIGDWGRLGRPDQTQVAQQMATACTNSAAKFVVSLGDNFYDYGVKSVDDPQWQKSFENVYTQPSLQVPWYVIYGNHDYRGNTAAQLEYGKTHPRWVMPARYYSQVHAIDATTKVECFYIDTSPLIKGYRNSHDMADVQTQEVAPQLEWLDKALAASTAQWKLVLGHHPIYSAGIHGNNPDLVEQILPLFEKYKVQAYFAGHDHDLQHLQANGMNFFVSGAGSEHREIKNTLTATHWNHSASGFAMASLSPEEMQISYIDNTGAQLYTAKAPRTV